MNRFKIASEDARQMVLMRRNEALVLAMVHGFSGNTSISKKWSGVAAYLNEILKQFEKENHEKRN
jgi:hypothetical protein